MSATRHQLADRLVFAGCFGLVAVSAAVWLWLEWGLRQIDRATTYPAVTR